MLNVYPKFERNQLKEVYSKLSKEEKKLIEDYLQYRAITSASPRKHGDIKRNIIQFRFIVQKNFSSIELKDLRDFLALLNNSNREVNTRNDLKSHIKNFLKWKYKDWSVRFEELRDIKLQKGFNEKKINSSTILKKQDIEKIMKQEHHLYWKTFFIALYESGVRPVELRTLKWSDVNFNIDENITELNVYSNKTKRARAVYIKEATFYLQRLKEESKNKSIYVFPSPRNINKPVTKNGICSWLKILSKKAIDREINPYLLRHSRATELYTLAKQNKISKDIATMFMGHSEDMSNFYTHLDKEQVKEMLTSQVYHLEDMPKKIKHKLEIENEKLREEIADFKAWIIEGLRQNKIKMPVTMIDEEGRKLYIKK